MSKHEIITRYRGHADTLRTIAKDANDAAMRLVLVTTADDFERMAESMEANERTPELSGGMCSACFLVEQS